MTPLEAWRIISADLAQLYKMRKAISDTEKGYTSAEVEAEVICFEALRRMEREGKGK